MTRRAIVLAAGAGTRLNPMTNGLPKCLVPFGERRLVDLQVSALQAAGVEEIVLVVGFEADQVRRHCRALQSVRFVDNPDFGSTNSIYSLWLARAFLDRETFLFNCDIVFHPALLERMLDGGMPNAIAVDSRVPRVAGEMNVSIRESGAVAAIGKDLDPADCQAQSVQLARFDAAGARSVAAEVERLVAGRRKDVFPTSAYGPLIERGELFAVEGGDLPWAEIDSVDDYNAAISTVLPRL